MEGKFDGAERRTTVCIYRPGKGYTEAWVQVIDRIITGHGALQPSPMYILDEIDTTLDL